VGIGLMFAIIGAIASIIVAAPAYQQSILAEHIELLQKPMRSEFYVLVLLGIGFWTALAGTRSPGRAAMRASIIASVPIALTGLLMLSGVLAYTEVLPGQIATTVHDRGILYTFYKGISRSQVRRLCRCCCRRSSDFQARGCGGQSAARSDGGLRPGEAGRSAPEARLPPSRRALRRPSKPDTTHYTATDAHAAKRSCSEGGLRM